MIEEIKSLESVEKWRVVGFFDDDGQDPWILEFFWVTWGQLPGGGHQNVGPEINLILLQGF